MLVYLSLDIICSSKFTVFLELCFLKSVRILELIMSTDKHQYIFLHQMEAIVYIISHYPRLSACGHLVRNDTMPLQTRPSPPAKGIKKWLKWTPVITESCYYRNVDTFVLSSTTFHLLFPPTITDTYSHNLKWHYNNSLLQTDLFPVHEATLEIQVCIVSIHIILYV